MEVRGRARRPRTVSGIEVPVPEGGRYLDHMAGVMVYLRRRVAPAATLGDGWRQYDREACVELVLDAAETLLGVLSVDRMGLTRGVRQTTLGEVIGDRGG